MASSKSEILVCPPTESATPHGQDNATRTASESGSEETAVNLQHAMAECSTQIATCRKLLDGLKKILADTGSHQSYQNGCAARDALQNTLSRLKKLHASYEMQLSGQSPEAGPASENSLSGASVSENPSSDNSSSGSPLL